MKTIVLSVFLFFFCFISFYSQDFKKMDVNGDGKIDYNEFKLKSRMFGKWDVNNDHKLSMEEFEDALFNLIDTNSDDVISESEWKRAKALIKTHKGVNTSGLDAWDSNGDGVVIKSEFISKLGPVFKSWDRNHDNYISRNEFNQQMFKWWDLNSDGVISEAEYNQIKELTKDNRTIWEKLFL